MASNSWPGYAPLYLAEELGYFDEHIQLKLMTSASEVMHAFRAESVQVAALTLDEALTLVEDQFDIKVILVMDFSDGGDVLMVKPNITSLQELRGKKIAVEYTAVGAIMLDGAMKAGGLTANDITIVNCPVDQHIECYPKNDAVVTFEPNKTLLANMGAKNLFDSRQIKGRIVDVLVVSSKLVTNQQALISKLVAGYFKARQYMGQEPSLALEKMSGYLGLSAEELKEAFTGLQLPGLEENHALLDRQRPGNIEESAQQLLTLMVEQSLLKAPFNIEQFIDNQYLPQ